MPESRPSFSRHRPSAFLGKRLNYHFNAIRIAFVVRLHESFGSGLEFGARDSADYDRWKYKMVFFLKPRMLEDAGRAKAVWGELDDIEGGIVDRTIETPRALPGVADDRLPAVFALYGAYPPTLVERLLEAVRTAFEEVYKSAGSGDRPSVAKERAECEQWMEHTRDAFETTADKRARKEALNELRLVPDEIHVRAIETPEDLPNRSSRFYPGIAALYGTGVRNEEHSMAHSLAHSHGLLSYRQRAISRF
ncbi:hypothetical protein JCM1841_003387 [Sporobolomyces salmonicolor]